MKNITIRPAQYEQFAALRAIELAAFETLRQTGAVTGEAGATSLHAFDALCKEGVLLAAYTPENIPVGFAGGYFADEWLHIAEADVHPDWQRQGIGRRLMQALLDAGRAQGVRGASLTTDRFASFNAPFYATLGFSAVEGQVLSPRLERVLIDESRAGLDPRRRVAMQLLF